MHRRFFQFISLCALLALTAGLASCGAAGKNSEPLSSVSVHDPRENKAELVASSIELPYGDESGPHPDNLTDVRIVRGSYEIPEFEEDPGFTTISAQMAVAKKEIPILTEMEDNVAMAGTLEKGDSFYILSEEEDGWLYVESGKVRGFLQGSAWEIAEETDSAKVRFAEQLLTPEENKAFFHQRITAVLNPAPIVYAVSAEKALPVLEERTKTARTIGTIPKGGVAYVLEECAPEEGAKSGEAWLYVESGYVRGFILQADVLYGEEADEWVNAQEEQDFPTAIAEIPFTENQAAWYTVTSVDPGRSVHDQAREFMQILGHARENELQIPESFSGRRVGHIFSCTPDYGIREWMFKTLEVFTLWQQYGSVYRDNIASIDDYYLIACTSTYGEVGDYVTFYLDDDTPIHCIIADQKSVGDAHYTTYGHIHGSDIDVIEAETLYNINPGQEGCVPEWEGHRVCSCVNHGEFQPF